MNQTVSFVVIAWAAVAGVWALVRAVIGGRVSPPSLSIVMLEVAVLAWLTTGLVAWSTGSPPARPLVFAGYALVAATVVPLGVSAARRLGGRRADLTRAIALGMLAFLCYRAEAVWLVAR